MTSAAPRIAAAAPWALSACPSLRYQTCSSPVRRIAVSRVMSHCPLATLLSSQPMFIAPRAKDENTLLVRPPSSSLKLLGLPLSAVCITVLCLFRPLCFYFRPLCGGDFYVRPGRLLAAFRHRELMHRSQHRHHGRRCWSSSTRAAAAMTACVSSSSCASCSTRCRYRTTCPVC